MTQSHSIDNPLDMPLLHALAVLDLRGEFIPAHNLDQIDACIAEYESAERLLASAEATYTSAKAGMIALVQAQGYRPSGTENSKEIIGRRNVARMTEGNTTVLQEQFVADLERYCTDEGIEKVFADLFATVITHKLVKGARTVLASLALPRTKHNRVLQLFARCFATKKKSPSLKVELIEPVKVARTPRAKKAVA